MGFDINSFEVVRNITKEFFVIPEDGSPMYLKFDSEFKTDSSIEIKTRKTTDGNKEPMEIADVTNLATGEVGRLIGNAVVKSELRASFPEDSYVGKMFSFTQGAQKTGRGGNKYRSFKIVELREKKADAGANGSTPAPAKPAVRK